MRGLRVVSLALWGLVAASLAGGMMGLEGCGAPPEAAKLARQEAVLLAAAAPDDAAVRDALTAQADAWNSLATLVQRRDLFGTPVDAAFVEIVAQTAALASRQRDLIAQGRDDPALNRACLDHLRRLWTGAARYLGN
jgi:hypothetical protein